MNKYDAVENLSEEQLLEIYDNIIDFGENYKLSKCYYVFVTCKDGYSSQSSYCHAGCDSVNLENNYLTPEKDGCYSFHESTNAICGNCSNYRSLFITNCP